MTGTEPLLLGALAGGGAGAAVGATGTGIAALAGLGALSGAQLDISSRQAGIDLAAIEANRQQAKLQAAEKALMNARTFRRALASQLAIANFRGGPGSSIAAQFGTESIASFLADQKAIQRGIRSIDTASELSRANTIFGREARDIGVFGGFASSLLGSTNLSRQGGSGGKRT